MVVRHSGQALVFELRGARGTQSRLQTVVRHDEEEVHARCHQHERDHHGEKRAVPDVAAVDGEHQRVEVGLAKRDGDDRIDDVHDQRGDQSSEGSADDECDRKLNDVALVEKVTKAFHTVLLVTRRGRITRRPPKG